MDETEHSTCDECGEGHAPPCDDADDGADDELTSSDPGSLAGADWDGDGASAWSDLDDPAGWV